MARPAAAPTGSWPTPPGSPRASVQRLIADGRLTSRGSGSARVTRCGRGKCSSWMCPRSRRASWCPRTSLSRWSTATTTSSSSTSPPGWSHIPRPVTSGARWSMRSWAWRRAWADWPARPGPSARASCIDSTAIPPVSSWSPERRRAGLAAGTAQGPARAQDVPRPRRRGGQCPAGSHREAHRS